MLSELKRRVKSTPLAPRVLRMVQSLAAPCLVILRYHSVREAPSALDAYIPADITHTATTFRLQMQYIARTCSPVSLNDLPELATGRHALPKRAVIITFDDGFRDNYEIAAPILEQYGLRGVFYVATSSVGGRPLWFVRLRHWSVQEHKTRPEFLEASARCASLSESEREEFLGSLKYFGDSCDSFTMSWAQVRDLLKRGHLVGSHSVNHPNLAKIPREEAIKEIACSKEILERELRVEVRHFCYPNPSLTPNWNQTTIEICENAGYATGATSNGGVVEKTSNILALPRHYVANSFGDFVWNLEMAFCKFKG
jgi:peptidoglycan/xylan/chitin deacetylase (PgdA/CDA1 family)